MDVKFLLGISCLLMVGVGLSSARSPMGDFATADIAKEIVENYLQDKSELDITLREDSRSGGLTELNYPEASKYGPLFSYLSQDRLVHIGIGFDKKVHPSSTVQDLQSSLGFVSLDRVPMPGFASPHGWNIYPLTPTSSFKAGVKIVSYESGRIHFKVDTNFFAVFGVMRGLNLPADASIPDDAHFKVRRNIRGMIDVNMPLRLAPGEPVAN